MVKQLHFKLMLLLCALVVGSGSLWADTSVTWAGTTALPGTATAVADDPNITIMTSSTNTYSNPIRVYANNTITIAANNGAKITSVSYEASSTGNYVTYAQDATVSPNVTPTVSGKIVTWSFAESANVTVFTFTPTSQTRSNGITITYTTGSNWNVTYDGNGSESGTVPTDATTYTASNNNVTVLGNTGGLAKTGYTFAGWNTKADGTGTSYTAGNTFTISASTTLYAKWTPNTHTVTLPTADAFGSYTMDATNPVGYDTEVTLTFTPAAGYENYEATWCINGVAITGNGNKFNMPDKDVTVTINLEEIIDYVTLPFSWAGGSSASFTGITGVTANGLGDYANNSNNYPYLIKLDGDGDYIQVKTDGQPGKVTIDVKMIGGATASTITVQGSANGETFTKVQDLSISGSQNTELTLETTNAFAADVRYVRLLFTKGSNVGVGPITIAVAPTDPAIVANETLSLTTDATSGAINYTINNPVAGTSLTAAVEAGCDWISNVTVGTESVTFSTTANPGAERSAVITLTYGGLTKTVTVTQAEHIVTMTYSRATTIVPGRHYIIVNEDNEKALGGQKTNNRDAVDIEIESNQTTITSDKGVHELLIEIDEETGYFTLYDESEDGYLYAASSSDNHLKTHNFIDDNSTWEITINENDYTAAIKAKGSYTHNILRYNSGGSTLFSCYTSSSTSVKPVCLYERVGDTGIQTFSVDINSACTDGSKYYATFSAPFAFIVPEDLTVSEISVVDGELLVENYATGAVVPANTGVMVSSTQAGEHAVNLTSAEGTSVLGADNMLKPTFYESDGISSSDMAATGATFYRLTMHNGSQIGFWWGADGGAAFDYLTPYRAYLALPSGARLQQSLWFGSEATGVKELKNARAEAPQTVFNLSGQRVSKTVKGLYIVGGKKVIKK